MHALLRAQLQAATEHAGGMRDPLRRQRQGRQRGHALRPARHRRRPDRRRVVESRRLRRHLPRRGLSAAPRHALENDRSPKMNWMLNLVVVLQILAGAGDDRPGADPARQGRRHGRLVRQRCVGQPVRRDRQRQLPVALDGSLRRRLLRLHARARLISNDRARPATAACSTGRAGAPAASVPRHRRRRRFPAAAQRASLLGAGSGAPAATAERRRLPRAGAVPK